MVGPLIVILTVTVLVLFLLAFLIYQAIFGHREERKEGLKYFTNEELGVKKKPYSFISNEVKINGFVYEISENTPKGIVVLVHGFGGGHINYMNEICFFAKLGYKVISYDNQGTMLSEGKTLKGFEQAVINLKDCIASIKSNLEYIGLKVILYGHSWGGYSVSAVSNFDDINVDGIISLSAFNSPSGMLTTMLEKLVSPILVILYPFFRIIEFFKFGKVSNFTALKGYKKCNCPLLLIHGEKDNMVPVDVFRCFRENLKERSDVEFIELPSKYHRPNITDEGVFYDNWFNSEASKLAKDKDKLKEFYENADYSMLTKFDERVMSRIKDFVERI